MPGRYAVQRAQAHPDMAHGLASTCRAQTFPPAGLAQYVTIDDSVRKRSVQPCIFLLQVLQPLGLVNLRATKLLASAEIGLLRYAKLAVDFIHCFALRRHDFCLAQLEDDVFGCESLLGHCLTLLFCSIRNFKSDHFFMSGHHLKVLS